jgi:hypothetical protein
MNNVLTGWFTSLFFLTIGVGIPSGKAHEPPQTPNEDKIAETKINTNIINLSIINSSSIDRINTTAMTQPAKSVIEFKWGDVSWLPILAAEAGWPEEAWPELGRIILRESGGCPNRRGGDAVDKNCNITHVTEWNHRSDTGLLQINGVNYNPKRNKWAIACRQLNICTQESLLDPLTNLKVGYLLYRAAGWGPWDPCTWGKAWEHRCSPKNKP